MPSLFARMVGDAFATVNEVLGVPCVFFRANNNQVVEKVNVIVNKNKKVTNEFKNVLGYRSEANFLKSQFPYDPRPGDTFTDPDGVTWRVNEITLDTNLKWYVDVRIK